MKKKLSEERAPAGRFSNILGRNYDRINTALPYLTTIEAKIAELACIRNRGKINVIDLGCGSGITTLTLCDARCNIQITAVDNEPQTIADFQKKIQATKNKLAADNNDIRVIESDALEFLQSCGKASVDVIVSGFFLHNVPSDIRSKIIEEIFRVLIPGGRFVNGDKIANTNMVQHTRDLAEELVLISETFKGKERERALGWIEHCLLDNEPRLRFTSSEAQALFERAGFQNITFTERHLTSVIICGDKPSLND